MLAAAQPGDAAMTSIVILGVFALVIFVRMVGQGRGRPGRRRRVTPASSVRAHAPKTMGSRRGHSRDDLVAGEHRMHQLERLREKGTLSDEEFRRTRDALRNSSRGAREPSGR